LRELGLDFGWGPTSVIQYLVENIHIYTGLPWYASLLGAVVLVRMATLKLFIDAADHTARQASIMPLLEPIQAEFNAARQNQDTQALMVATKRRSQLLKSAGVSMRKIFYPMVVQMPFAFGTFRFTRGASDLPVPGFDVGGALWFQDLTIADPTYMLPLATSAALYYTFKVSPDYPKMDRLTCQ
jgi:YidC/Oxa1 family membrane protein insertase